MHLGYEATGHLVTEYVLFPDPELLEDVELLFQVPDVIVSLANSGLAVCDGDDVRHIGALCEVFFMFNPACGYTTRSEVGLHNTRYETPVCWGSQWTRKHWEEPLSSREYSPTYRRAPSDIMKALLSPNGFLAPLVEGCGETVEGLQLDVHLRRNDEVHVYCGLTRILRVRRNRNNTVTVSAHQAYSNQDCAKPLLRQWTTSEVQEFRQALHNYVSQVQVPERHRDQEGRLQAEWSRIKEPWTPFDREAVLEYRTKEESNNARQFQQLDRAHTEVECIAESQRKSSRQRDVWAMPEAGGREVDQLAVDADGRLVLVELKSATATPSAVYYAPYQLLRYVWEWHRALESVLPRLQELVDARVDLSMTHESIPKLSGDLRAGVCFDRELATEEVRVRYERVLELVNRYLPKGVPEIETWTMSDVPSLVDSAGQYPV